MMFQSSDDVILSLDLSTTTCGYSVFVNGGLYYSDYIPLVYENKFRKIKLLDAVLGPYLERSNHIILEKFIMYMKGRSSAYSITRLCEFSGIFQGLCYSKYNKEPEFISHLSAVARVIPDIKVKRGDSSVLKKYGMSSRVPLTKAWGYDFYKCSESSAKEYYNKKGKFMKENLDISDSYINGLYYVRFFQKEEGSTQD